MININSNLNSNDNRNLNGKTNSNKEENNHKEKRAKLLKLAIIHTITSIMVCIIIAIYLFSAIQLDIDGTNLLEPVAAYITGVICLIQILFVIKSWQKLFKSKNDNYDIMSKIAVNLIVIIVGIIFAVPHVINFVDKYKEEIIQAQEQFFEQKDESIKMSKDNYLFKNLSFNTENKMEENVQLAKEKIIENTELFEKQISTKLGCSKSTEEDPYGSYYIHILKYNDNMDIETPTANYRHLSYSYIFFNDMGENDCIVFDYQQLIEGHNHSVNIDIDLIVDDIESVFGEITNEKKFREVLEDEVFLLGTGYNVVDNHIFDTASGVPIRIESKYDTSDYGISISGHYSVNINP